MKSIFFVAVTFLFTGTSYAQLNKNSAPAKGNITIDRFIGTPMHVISNSGVELNKGSTLNRDAFVIRDSSAPLILVGEPTPKVIYKPGDRYSTSQYNYSIQFFVKPEEPIVAFELKSIVINIFGQFITTLVSIRVTDITDKWEGNSEWQIWPENNAYEAFTFITYINKVRTASGKFYEIDQKAVLAQAAKVANKLTEADLEPKLDPKK